MGTRLESIRKDVGATVVDGFFRGIAKGSLRTPVAQRALRRHEIIRNVQYGDLRSDDHVLDVYLPNTNHPGPHPVAFYIHGGGFRILSKETHWLMALAFARQGYVVFNIDYRLAPKHPFPAAAEDACVAYRWIVENAHHYGGDVSRLVVAGESAGANLCLGVTLASVLERPEPWAASVFETEIVPKAAVVACGMLQVSDWQRLVRNGMPVWLQDRLAEVPEAYLGDTEHHLAFADPLVLLEQTQQTHRPLPPVFAPVGTKDPLLDDTRRLARAVRRHGGVVDERYYVGEIHAFHAMLWRRNAFRCWRDQFNFLNVHVP